MKYPTKGNFNSQVQTSIEALNVSECIVEIQSDYQFKKTLRDAADTEGKLYVLALAANKSKKATLLKECDYHQTST